jgi:hypothetical protein
MGRRSKKSFKDLSPTEQRAVIGIVAVALPLIAAAQRDLGRRSADEVVGSKLLWRLLCLNGAGAVAYFAFGRRSG